MKEKTYKHFITNRSNESSLAEIITGIMPKTSSLDTLVGYFYFSGIKEIYQNISNKQMRVLVGLELDKEIQNKVFELDLRTRKQHSSLQQRRSDFNEALVALFNTTNYFENEDTKEAFKIYYEKIKDGSLEIRKTSD
ncbi:MAG: helicase, partial [Synergistaceae bacterium]|nr:helicase [Synergistaceae bacterium]